MTRSHRLGELQLAVLQILWTRKEATASEVHEALRPTRGAAFTTITTTLGKLEEKGLVEHRTEGRAFVYRPAVAQSEVQGSMVAELTDRLFQGDAVALVSNLLSRQDIDPSELARIKALIEEEEQRRD